VYGFENFYIAARCVRSLGTGLYLMGKKASQLCWEAFDKLSHFVRFAGASLSSFGACLAEPSWLSLVGSGAAWRVRCPLTGGPFCVL
jgi:hypothetical protein